TTTLAATASSHLTVSFSSQTPSVCTVSGTTLTVVAAGTCTVAANQAGDGAFWLPAPTVTQSVTITSGRRSTAQSIHFATPSDHALGSGPFQVSATASSGLAVSFTSQTTGVCTVSGNTVTLLALGVCTLVASQPGDATYAAATPVSRSFSVTSNGGGENG